MEEKLAHDDAVAGQVALERPDVLVPLVPQALGEQFARDLLLLEDFRVDANDQRLFVVTAVENADAAAFGHALRATPQEIVVEFLAGRRLERVDLAALRVDPGHHVFDRAVFARGIHGLENQQHRPLVLRIKFVLQFGQRLDTHGQRLFRARFVLVAQMERVGGVVILEAEFFPVRHAERLGERARDLDDLGFLHGGGGSLEPCA